MGTTIAIDPGESVGIIINDNTGLWGLTVKGPDRNSELWKLLVSSKPSAIVYEEFALRAKAATKLIGSKFITCEVIGVIKLYAQLREKEGGNFQLIALPPYCKEYCGFSSKPGDDQYKNIRMGTEKITEHVRDAYRLYRYAKLFKGVH